MKFLIIQTAFIGDVILATSLIEKLHNSYPEAEIDFLLRKGNEGLLENHPFLNRVIIWNKKNNKYKNLFQTIGQLRESRYNYIINCHRFASSGIFSFFTKGKTLGFSKNPFSFLFYKRYPHHIQLGIHEVDRNISLLNGLTDLERERPRLYPDEKAFKSVNHYKSDDYITISPTSVWFTKQYPASKWLELLNKLGDYRVYLLGGKDDTATCNSLMNDSGHSRIVNLCGELSFLESVALMRDARMNYVNDSAPMHMASSINAKVTAIFCSTQPKFGFGPLSDESFVVETKEILKCRPCGLHGKSKCPENHFKCATTIDLNELTSSIKDPVQ